jgi:hypothetical protein
LVFCREWEQKNEKATAAEAAAADRRREESCNSHRVEEKVLQQAGQRE